MIRVREGQSSSMGRQMGRVECSSINIAEVLRCLEGCCRILLHGAWSIREPTKATGVRSSCAFVHSASCPSWLLFGCSHLGLTYGLCCRIRVGENLTRSLQAAQHRTRRRLQSKVPKASATERSRQFAFCFLSVCASVVIV